MGVREKEVKKLENIYLEIGQLGRKRDELRDQSNAYEEETKQMREDVERLEGEKKVYEDSFDYLKKQTAIEQEKLNGIDQKIIDKELELRELQKKISSIGAIIADKTKDLEDIQNRLKNAEQRLDDREGEIVKREERLKDNFESLKAWEMDLNLAKIQIDQRANVVARKEKALGKESKFKEMPINIVKNSK